MVFIEFHHNAINFQTGSDEFFISHGAAEARRIFTPLCVSVSLCELLKIIMLTEDAKYAFQNRASSLL